jgi:hypothetical protein
MNQHLWWTGPLVVAALMGCAGTRSVAPSASYTDGNIHGVRTSKGWQYSYEVRAPSVDECNAHGNVLRRQPQETPDVSSYRRSAHYLLQCLNDNYRSGSEAAKEVERRAKLIVNTDPKDLSAVLRSPPFVPLHALVSRVDARMNQLVVENGRLQAQVRQGSAMLRQQQLTIERQKAEIEAGKARVTAGETKIDQVQRQLDGIVIHVGPGATVLEYAPP